MASLPIPPIVTEARQILQTHRNRQRIGAVRGGLAPLVGLLFGLVLSKPFLLFAAGWMFLILTPAVSIAHGIAEEDREDAVEVLRAWDGVRADWAEKAVVASLNHLDVEGHAKMHAALVGVRQDSQTSSVQTKLEGRSGVVSVHQA